MITEDIKAKSEAVNLFLEEFLPKEIGRQSTLFEAMNYSVRVGGKRLRPIIMIESAKLFGEIPKVIYSFAAALEMIHTYSLVHDDLPAMDNDLLRRGMPTTHAKYGEAMAILAGDGLLNLAFETAIKTLEEYPGDDRVSKALMTLSRKAGIYGMIGGQSVDVESEKAGYRLSLEDVNFVHELKTCALIEAATTIGAILGGADKTEQSQMSLVGKNIGMAFQIQDDILDIEGNEEVVGKPIGSDERNHKETMATHLGIDAAKMKVREYTQKGIEILKTMPGDHKFLEELFIYLITRNS